MVVQDEREFRLEIGSTVIGLVCESAEYASSLAEYFARPPVIAAADIRLDLQIIAHTDTPDIPNSLFTTKRVEAGSFDIADGLICGDFDPATATGTLRVKNILTKGMLPRVFEQVLYQAYYSARNVRGADGLLIHSSGVIADGAGCLFVGASGQGKSTVADLSVKYLVVNDEMNLVELTADEGILHGSPFNGFYEQKSPGQAPLRGIFLLSHGPEHRLQEVGMAEAVAAVATQIVPPVGLEDAVSPDIRLTMIDLATRLCAVAPVWRLEFTPDVGFWEIIARELAQAPRK